MMPRLRMIAWIIIIVSHKWTKFLLNIVNDHRSYNEYSHFLSGTNLCLVIYEYFISLHNYVFRIPDIINIKWMPSPWIGL